jgi:cyclohexyl-isocyanide hydratase
VSHEAHRAGSAAPSQGGEPLRGSPELAIRVVFAVFPGVTQLDFTGPLQVLGAVPGTEVVVASGAGGEIEAEGGLRFQSKRLDAIESCTVLCVPGGASCTDAMSDARYLDEVRRLATSARYTTSVCTGSLILGAAGLLRGRRAACHWAWLDQLALFGAVPDPSRIVRDGNLLTGGGVTAGIDFALTLAAELAGKNVAMAIQLGLEYAPAPPFHAGRPEEAPPQLVALVKRSVDPSGTRRIALAAAAARAARFTGEPGSSG